MQNKKKIISVILALIIALSAWSVVPVGVSAAEAEVAATGIIDEANPDYTYYILNDGTAVIERYRGEGGDVTIPSTLGGYTVTRIGDTAFNSDRKLTSVTIPDSVTSIGELVFTNCTSLTSVTIGNSVTSIGRSSFWNCTELTSVTIPDSVTSIGEDAFGYYFDKAEQCNKKNDDFTIFGYTGSEAERYADNNGFSFFTPSESDFKYTVLENGTAMIRKHIGESKSVTIPSTLDGYTVTSIGLSVFSGCTELTSIDIPDSVTSIGSSAFSGCTGLTSIDIPDSVTSIGNFAFSGCTGLTSIDIPESVTSISDGMFSSCTGLTSVTIPESVTSIGSSAFSGCTGLTSIDIPDAVTSIGEGAFRNCSGLTSVVIPDLVTGIGDGTFGGCSGLTSITIGKSVTSIGYPFYGCTGLTSIKVAEGNTVYDSRDNCNAIIRTESDTLVYGFKISIIPDSVTSLGSEAFQSCKGLTSIDIPDSVTSIGNHTFNYCTDLTSVTFGSSVWTIRGFQGCTSLTRIDIPDTVRNIDDFAFFHCTGLTSITIPDSVKSIGNRAFQGCTGLTSVSIPDSIESIGSKAFFDCTGLTSVTIPDINTERGYFFYDAFGYYAERQNNKVDGFTIYGYEDSEAEKYAEYNEFTFVPLKAKADKATGIILAVPENTNLTVKDITADICSKLPGNFNVLTAYDITLTKDGETVQPENIVPVKIPCTNENAKVFRLEADGNLTDMHAKYADGYMVFTTDHFSIYVLVEPKTEGVTVPGDVTGDGKTNVQDCTAILRYVRQIDALSDEQLKCGDVTGDGKVNVQDVTRILRHVRQIEALY